MRVQKNSPSFKSLDTRPHEAKTAKKNTADPAAAIEQAKRAPQNLQDAADTKAADDARKSRQPTAQPACGLHAVAPATTFEPAATGSTAQPPQAAQAAAAPALDPAAQVAPAQPLVTGLGDAARPPAVSAASPAALAAPAMDPAPSAPTPPAVSADSPAAHAAPAAPTMDPAPSAPTPDAPHAVSADSPAALAAPADTAPNAPAPAPQTATDTVGLTGPAGGPADAAQAAPTPAPQPATDTVGLTGPAGGPADAAQTAPAPAPQPATDTVGLTGPAGGPADTAPNAPAPAPQPATDTAGLTRPAGGPADAAQAAPTPAPQTATDTVGLTGPAGGPADAAQTAPAPAPQTATDTVGLTGPAGGPADAAQAAPTPAPQTATDTVGLTGPAGGPADAAQAALALAAQAATDAAALNTQFGADPAGAAAALRDKMEGTQDPAYRAALLDRVSEKVAASFSALHTGQLPGHHSTHAALTADVMRAAELAGPAATERLAGATASALDETPFATHGELGRAVREGVSQSSSSLFGVKLAQAIDDKGDISLSRSVSRGVRMGAQDVTDRFQRQHVEMHGLEEKWANLSRDMVGRLPPETVQAARTRFEAQNAEAFAAYERTAGELGQVMSGLSHVPAEGTRGTRDLARAADSIAGQAEKLQQSDAGQEALFAQLNSSAAGKPHMLDRITEQMVRTNKQATAGANFLMKLTANGAMRAMARGDHDAAKSLVDGLRSRAGLLGISPEHAQTLTDRLHDVIDAPPGLRARATSAFASELDKVKPLLGGAVLQDGFKLIGSALSVGAGVSALTDGRPDHAEEALKHVVDVASGSADVAVNLANLVGRNHKFMQGLHGVGSAAGKLLGPVGMALDAGFALQQLENGEYGKAALSGLSLAGATAMMIPGGQLVGAGLLAASVVGNIAHGYFEGRADKRQAEADIQAALHDAGFSEAQARVLGRLNADGSAFQQVFDAQSSPDTALNALLAMSPEALAAAIPTRVQPRRGPNAMPLA